MFNPKLLSAFGYVVFLQGIFFSCGLMVVNRAIPRTMPRVLFPLLECLLQHHRLLGLCPWSSGILYSNLQLLLVLPLGTFQEWILYQLDFSEELGIHSLTF